MSTFDILNKFNNTLIKLASQANYYPFSKSYKVGRIHIAFSNMESAVKEKPIRLEELTSFQMKSLGFEYRNGLRIIPLQFRKFLPDNLEVYEQYTLEATRMTSIKNDSKYGIIPYKIKYIQEGLSEGFCYYIRHGRYPNESI